jgi:nicotinate phosphoribosyltransferase
MTLPGEKQVWRILEKSGKATADLICLAEENPGEGKELTLINVLKDEERRKIQKDNIIKLEPLLIDIISDGKLNYIFPTITKLRESRDGDLSLLDFGVKRIINPHNYQVSISEEMFKLKQKLINKINGKSFQ